MIIDRYCSPTIEVGVYCLILVRLATVMENTWGKIAQWMDICLATSSECLLILWLFTKDDFFTFALPNTVFGISVALSEPVMTDCLEHLPVYTVTRRLPLVIFFNWSNLLIFDLANQKSPASIKEDLINKAWRPIPAGRVSRRQMRYLLMTAIPMVLLSAFLLNVWKETALLLNLTWMYNDLGGGDDNWLVRNLIIAFAFFLYNIGSLKVARGGLCQREKNIENAAYIWTAVISAVILTTMQIQDLKDQEGDRIRGRRTAPLILGDSVARWTIVIAMLFWSLVFARYSGFSMLSLVVGCYVAYRVWSKRGREEDRRSWKLWSLWLVSLYLLPLEL